jgi:hypothetical protein
VRSGAGPRATAYGSEKSNTTAGWLTVRLGHRATDFVIREVDDVLRAHDERLDPPQRRRLHATNAAYSSCCNWCALAAHENARADAPSVRQ